MFLPFLIFIIHFDITLSQGCSADSIKNYLTSDSECNDPPCRNRNYIADNTIKDINDGDRIPIACPGNDRFAIEWSVEELLCDKGIIKPGEDENEMKFNFCIKSNECSYSEFIEKEGFRIYDKLEDYSTEKKPWVVTGLTTTDIKSQKTKMQQFLKQIQSNKFDMNEYPFIALQCGLAYTIEPVIANNLMRPAFYCIDSKNQKHAKWTRGNDVAEWQTLHQYCKKKEIGLSLTPLIPGFVPPPPNGCGPLDKKDCSKYSKYCAYVKQSKYKAKFTTQVDIEKCTKPCHSWSCYSYLIIESVKCENAVTEDECKQVPKYIKVCYWEIKAKECLKKYETGIKIPVYLDICLPNDNVYCRNVHNDDAGTSQWFADRELTYQGMEKNNKLRPGYEEVILGVRHRVDPLNGMTLIGGIVVSSIRATKKPLTVPVNGELEKAPVDIMIYEEGSQSGKDEYTLKSKYNLISQTKWKAYTKIAGALLGKNNNKNKNIPAISYFSVTLQSDAISDRSEMIDIYVDTYITEALTGGGFLDWENWSAKGASSKFLPEVRYTYSTSITKEISKVAIKMWEFQKKPTLFKDTNKLKITMKPGPEKCGYDGFSCFVEVIWDVNEVFDSLYKITGILTLKQRLKGFPKNAIYVFGVQPKERKEVIARYKVKKAKTEIFVQNSGQYANLRWKFDYGTTKSIKVDTSVIPEQNVLITEVEKISFNANDEIKITVDKTKWVFLKTSKPLTKTCRIQAVSDGPLQFSKTIKIRSGFGIGKMNVKAMEPGIFVVTFKIDEKCINTVSDPLPLQINVYSPGAGRVKVPETLKAINNVFSDSFDISITRPPFRTWLNIKPQTDAFQADPSEVKWINLQMKSIQKASAKLSRVGATPFSKNMKIKPILECGGGPPYKLNWILSGAISEFYPPTTTYVTVEPGDSDEDYCVYNIQMSNGTESELDFSDVVADDEEQTIPEPEIKVEPWRFEYYLIGGAICICIMIIIRQFRDEKFDRMIQFMAKSI